MTPRIITIDGPAGAGKSTVGKAVAKRLGLEYLDTGAMYRAVTFAALRRGIPVTDEDAVAALARQLDMTVDEHTVEVDGVDATADVRSREVTEGVSAIAANTPRADGAAGPPTSMGRRPRRRCHRGAGHRNGRVPEGDLEAVHHGDTAGARRTARR